MIDLDYTKEDLHGWLQSLPSDYVVHNGRKYTCKHCTIATFLQDKMDRTDIEVGYDVAHDSTTEYKLPIWFTHAILVFDSIVRLRSDQQLTAKDALELVDNFDF